MAVSIVVGVQWGDEGKGKVVDYLTEQADLVVRFQGGNNAGHTLVIDGQKTALQLIPSGILRPGTRCLLASGVVLNPFSLIEEIDRLAEINVAVTPERLGIANNVQLILPYHLAVDRGREAELAEGKIGTTGKGIGPAYEDAVSRCGIRLCDLFDARHLASLVERNVAKKNAYLSRVLGTSDCFSADELLVELNRLAEFLRPYATDVSIEVSEAVKAGKEVVFEGAQGCLLDISHGTYPFVTSSNTVAAYACVSAGVGPQIVDSVVGICKAYCTRVGSGPFPTEDFGVDGQKLREAGREFGTVTGRPRRCGWFDAAAVKKAVRLNGIDSLVITKLDVLSGFKKIRLGTAYTIDGVEVNDIPVSPDVQDRLQVTYEDFPGWDDDITAVREFSKLPLNAQKLLQRIEQLSESRIVGFSVGPDRVQTIRM